MKKSIAALASLALLTPSATAFASVGRSDHSGFVVWIFLGFCGLIVAAQLIPALLVMLGLVKGATEKQPEPAREKVH
ncbi:hypothetical protein [Trichloromonas acetexigens]|uniref:Uncharacterized protein n=1 Tax=Trichloromonas acetexigens TaxID=38815 RepID=A0A550J8E2_9BACT|nr:hypothetical protein [Desulfuromonas acetexigens]TRO79510.1 hypothetical protein FL622_13290 [Desulfuromonas acetexigens]